MRLDEDYVKYSLVPVLSLISIISLMFLDFSRPETFAVLLSAPLLFGYTAYVSRKSFQRASLLSAAVLPFVTFGRVYLIFAVVLITLNVLVSFFASGKSFRSFYGSTSLPLLGSGVLVAGLFLSMTLTQPGFAGQVENTTAEMLGQKTETVIEQSDVIGMQRETRSQMVGSIGEASVGLTQVYVMNETGENLSRTDQRALIDAFASAREEVPRSLEEKANRSLGLDSVDFSEKSEGLVKNLFVEEMFLLFLPLIVFGMYGLQPVVGILTALSGVFFRELDGYLGETT
jgi:hypothetical protein